ncbi:cytochrome P450 [Saccharopolyspora taberi]|uniref:Cytochrome P450 n=1 Tax=Saccharopolyspora taberi TaxID=60895 RepID=A0ABN3V7X7_9PSEU
MTGNQTSELPVFDEAFATDPHSHYARLRPEAPVHRIRAYSGFPLWIVTRYAEARQVLADPRFAKNFQRVSDLIESQLPPDADGRKFSADLGAHMLNMDPPDHTRLRKLVVKAFTARRVEALRPRIEEITAELLDRIEGRPAADLIDEFAFPLPIKVITELLGVDESRRDEFREWSNVLVDSSDQQAIETASEQMKDYLVELLGKKRAQPGDDLLTALIEAEDDHDRLTEGELIAMVFLLLVAGHETTVNLIGNCVLALLTNQDQLAALRADLDLVDGAIEETLRFESPVMQSTFRYTTEAAEIGGVEIPADQVVWVALGSANRDGERFEDPEVFDIRRTTTGHLAFGHGIHFCLGAPLARMEGQIAVRRLLERFPDLALDGPADDLRWRVSNLMRGLEELPVRTGA